MFKEFVADMTQSLPSKSYLDRHIGPSENEREAMLNRIGYSSLEALVDAAVPNDIRESEELNSPHPSPKLKH